MKIIISLAVMLITAASGSHFAHAAPMPDNEAA